MKVKLNKYEYQPDGSSLSDWTSPYGVDLWNGETRYAWENQLEKSFGVIFPFRQTRWVWTRFRDIVRDLL